MEKYLILIIVILVIGLIIGLIFLRSKNIQITGAKAVAVAGAGRSKLEERIISILEGITGQSFDQAHPSWLRDDTDVSFESKIEPKVESKIEPKIQSKIQRSPSGLELDGYNEQLGLAVEIQGPGHTKPLPHESYEKYRARVARDKLKHELCRAHGVHLLAIDYRIPLTNMSSYLRSRLFDLGIIADRPPNYIKEIIATPWEHGK